MPAARGTCPMAANRRTRATTALRVVPTWRDSKGWPPNETPMGCQEAVCWLSGQDREGPLRGRASSYSVTRPRLWGRGDRQVVLSPAGCGSRFGGQAALEKGLSGDGGAEVGERFARDVTLQTARDPALDFPSFVDAGVGMRAHAGEHDPPQGMVGLAVPGVVRPDTTRPPSRRRATSPTAKCNSTPFLRVVRSPARTPVPSTSSTGTSRISGPIRSGARLRVSGRHAPLAGALPAPAEPPPAAAAGAPPRGGRLGVIVEREPFRADHRVEQLSGHRVHPSSNQLPVPRRRSRPRQPPNRPDRPPRRTHRHPRGHSSTRTLRCVTGTRAPSSLARRLEPPCPPGPNYTHVSTPPRYPIVITRPQKSP